MEKIVAKTKQQYSYVILHRDELEEIVNRLKKVSNEIFIKIDDYYLDNLEEIPELKKDFAKYIDIRTENPKIWITFSSNLITIDSYNTDLEVEACKILLGRIIENKVSNLWKFSSTFLPKINSIIIGITLPIISLLNKQIKNELLIKILLSFLLINAILFIFSTINFGKPTNKYNLNYKHEKKPFISKNKDEIIINIFFFLIGLAAGNFEKITIFLNRLFQTSIPNK